MQGIFRAIAIAGFGVVALGAGASQASSLGRACTTAPQSQFLPSSELQAKVEAQGYKVQRVKLAKGCAEVYALDSSGSKVELFLDPTNGSVIGRN